ncbi:MAG: exodeoxyribonuclease VII large subunit [Legionellales bacterium RIFCSPHIGHO2_12_FULL_35_11]|nr:MAG: exodeoxyribonuclease VII large subunit [Legionellales bacterium RIFCSPHIGHO2_12_FULL_35_11]
MQALTVSQLNRKIKILLEDEVGEVLVGGEVSNLSKPASGHLYFTLKDETAQIRCVFFKNRQLKSGLTLQNGQQVIASGHLSLYEARGDYQLIVELINEDGLGDLHKLFELLKTKLQVAGLFDIARKKVIPKFPNCIGIITSSSGAALQDILTTLKRRYPLARVIVYPSDVQGKSATPQLVASVKKANADNLADVIIIARGGGSLEDLWSFNDERLAYAIFESNIPVVSGVGHEIDFTIADFVADLRAATPTAAAEAVTPNKEELLMYLNQLLGNIEYAMRLFLRNQNMLLQHEIKKITSPDRMIAAHWQKLDYLEIHMQRVVEKTILIKNQELHILLAKIHSLNPRSLLMEARGKLAVLEEQLLQLIRINYRDAEERLKSSLVTLHAVSPLATLDRGYAIVMLEGKPIYQSRDVAIGSSIDIRLSHGKLFCEVLKNE